MGMISQKARAVFHYLYEDGIPDGRTSKEIAEAIGGKDGRFVVQELMTLVDACLVVPVGEKRPKKWRAVYSTSYEAPTRCLKELVSSHNALQLEARIWHELKPHLGKGKRSSQYLTPEDLTEVFASILGQI